MKKIIKKIFELQSNFHPSRDRYTFESLDEIRHGVLNLNKTETQEVVPKTEAHDAAVWMEKEAFKTVFVIKNPEGLYSSGGSKPTFGDTRKEWESEKGLNLHVNLLKKNKAQKNVYKNCIVQKWIYFVK